MDLLPNTITIVYTVWQSRRKEKKRKREREREGEVQGKNMIVWKKIVVVFEFIAILSRSTPTLRSPFDETPYFFRSRAKRVALWWPNLSCPKRVPLVMGKRVIVLSLPVFFLVSR